MKNIKLLIINFLILGEAGGGGVLFGPDGDRIFTYSWNLGIESNNMAEALALWQGLNQALLQGIQALTVVGDSRMIIHSIKSLNLPSSIRLRQVLRRISFAHPSLSRH
jgi:ribonuclease HI